MLPCYTKAQNSPFSLTGKRVREKKHEAQTNWPLQNPESGETRTSKYLESKGTTGTHMLDLGTMLNEGGKQEGDIK